MGPVLRLIQFTALVSAVSQARCQPEETCFYQVFKLRMFKIGRQEWLHLHFFRIMPVICLDRAVLPGRALQFFWKVAAIDMPTLVCLKIILPMAEYRPDSVPPIGQQPAIRLIICFTPDASRFLFLDKQTGIFTDDFFREVIRFIDVITLHDPYDYFIRPCLLEHLAGFTVTQVSPAPPRFHRHLPATARTDCLPVMPCPGDLHLLPTGRTHSFYHFPSFFIIIKKVRRHDIVMQPLPYVLRERLQRLHADKYLLLLPALPFHPSLLLYPGLCPLQGMQPFFLFIPEEPLDAFLILGAEKSAFPPERPSCAQIIKRRYPPCGRAILFPGKRHEIVPSLKDGKLRAKIPLRNIFLRINIQDKDPMVVYDPDCRADNVCNLFRIKEHVAFRDFQLLVCIFPAFSSVQFHPAFTSCAIRSLSDICPRKDI